MVKIDSKSIHFLFTYNLGQSSFNPAKFLLFLFGHKETLLILAQIIFQKSYQIVLHVTVNPYFLIY